MHLAAHLLCAESVQPLPQSIFFLWHSSLVRQLLPCFSPSLLPPSSLPCSPPPLLLLPPDELWSSPCVAMPPLGLASNGCAGETLLATQVDAPSATSRPVAVASSRCSSCSNAGKVALDVAAIARSTDTARQQERDIARSNCSDREKLDGLCFCVLICLL